MANKEDIAMDDAILETYGGVMATILTIGVVGNFTFLLVLFQPEHRKRPMSILIINLCAAELMVCLFGYSVALSYNLVHEEAISRRLWQCEWLAFINSVTGIACIATLAAMSFMSYKGVTSQTSHGFSKKEIASILGGVWLYAVLLTIPPVFGWNEFVPVAGKSSCHPNWVSHNTADVVYIAVLTFGGFFVPITCISFCYLKMFRFMKQNSFQEWVSNDPLRQRSLATEKKTIRVIIAVIVAFMISWSPYCFVSLSSTVIGHDILTPTASFVPQLMAKASVIYNPIVYLSLNSRYRATLKGLIRKVRVKPQFNTSRRRSCNASKSDSNDKVIDIRAQRRENLDELPRSSPFGNGNFSVALASEQNRSSQHLTHLSCEEEGEEKAAGRQVHFVLVHSKENPTPSHTDHTIEVYTSDVTSQTKNVHQ